MEALEQEKSIYKYDLKKSTKLEDSVLYDSFATFDDELATKLMLHYINRCCFKHSLAFF
jgi:hypothetical protein